MILFKKYFGLTPYGDSLRTQGAMLWLFCVRLVIVIMSLAEGVSWAYIGSRFGIGYMRPITALCSGLAIFCIIWVVDATFVTLDTSRRFYERKLSDDKTESVSIKEYVKMPAGIFTRLLIVVGSLFISAPFLAQIVFQSDIDSYIIDKNRISISEKRLDERELYESKINNIRAKIDSLAVVAIRDAAGQGPSGIIGRGGTVETIEKQIQLLSKQIGEIQVNYDETMDDFDILSQEEIAERYGLSLIEDGISSREDALAEIMSKPTFSRAEWAIRAFLGFLFLSLVLLKVFQPRSISIYYNEQLQRLYDQYHRGVFDKWIADDEKSKSEGKMSPLRFEDWVVNTYSIIRKEDQEQRRSSEKMVRFKSTISQLKDFEKSTKEELVPEVEELEKLKIELENMESEMYQKAKLVDEYKKELSTVSKELASLSEIRLDGIENESFHQLMKRRQNLRGQFDKWKELLHKEEINYTVLKRMYDNRQREHDIAIQSIKRLEEDLDDVRKRISNLRRKYVEEVGTGNAFINHNA